MSGESERLDRVLSHQGMGTRKDAGRMIAGGRVLVNGKEASDPGMHVRPGKDIIALDGTELDVRFHRHIMMNKPAGTVCSSREGSFPTVYSLLDGRDGHEYLGGSLCTVGRLDADTEGLLLFTTDGPLNHFLTSPKNRVPRTYLVRLETAVSGKTMAEYSSRLSEGIHIEADGREEAADCLPAELEWSGGTESVSECRLTVHEGKFHEVKRMFIALGNRVAYLKRISFGALCLDEGLGPGQYRDLDEDELKLLKEVH